MTDTDELDDPRLDAFIEKEHKKRMRDKITREQSWEAIHDDRRMHAMQIASSVLRGEPTPSTAAKWAVDMWFLFQTFNAIAMGTATTDDYFDMSADKWLDHLGLTAEFGATMRRLREKTGAS